MLATRDEKGQILLVLETYEEASEMWHRLNISSRCLVDGIPYKEDSWPYVDDFDPDYDGYHMWDVLDVVMQYKEEATNES